MIYIITVAYCRSAQLARCLMEYSRSCDEHIFVQGHYPIDTERNNEEIKLIVDSYSRKEHVGYVRFLDPGKDLGSAQSQQWALEQLNPGENDYWVNLDPDSICRSDDWETAMEMVLDADPNCIAISCMSPMVKKFLAERKDSLMNKEINRISIGIPTRPTPFNLTMFRCSFIKEMGGLRQMFPSWGELEAIIYHEAILRGKYHAYLLDHMEDESNKFFHPKSNAEWKDLHARTIGPEQFLGSYGEFLAYKYPELASLKI